jgi:hypothetical protein
MQAEASLKISIQIISFLGHVCEASRAQRNSFGEMIECTFCGVEIFPHRDGKLKAGWGGCFIDERRRFEPSGRSIFIFPRKIIDERTFL